MKTCGWLLVVVGLVACGKKKEGGDPPAAGSGSAAGSGTAAGSGSAAAKAPEPPPPPPKAEPLEVSIKGKQLTIVSQYAVPWAKGYTVRLFTKAHTCTDALNDEDNSVSFDVLSGPGGKYFAGQPVFPSVRARLSDSRSIPEYVSKLTVEPFESKKGAHIKGTIAVDWPHGSDVYKISGPFDAEICTDPEDGKRKKLPETADAALAGTAVGKPFTAKSCIAFLKHGSYDKVDYISDLYCYPTAATCADYYKRMYESLHAQNFGGADSKNNATKVAQPATFFIYENQNAGHGWIKFDTLDLKVGGTITGSLATTYSDGAEAKDHVDVAGTFSATVCE